MISILCVLKRCSFDLMALKKLPKREVIRRQMCIYFNASQMAQVDMLTFSCFLSTLAKKSFAYRVLL